MRSQSFSHRLPNGEFPRTPYPFKYLEFPPFESTTQAEHQPSSSGLRITNPDDRVQTPEIVASSGSPQELPAEVADASDDNRDYATLTGSLGDAGGVGPTPDLDDYEPSVDPDNYSLTEEAVEKLLKQHYDSHRHQENLVGSDTTAQILLGLKEAGYHKDFSSPANLTASGSAIPTTEKFSPSVDFTVSSPLLKRKSSQDLARSKKRQRPVGLSPIKTDIEPPHQWVPTPVSPDRQFVSIIAERPSREGTLYKVVWRDSWVHESKLPDLEPVRLFQMSRNGKAWDVLAGESLDSSSC